MPARVFVTGATGVLGRRAVSQLIAAGHRVTAVARTDPKAALLRDAGATPVRVDLFDKASVHAALLGHDAVAQLATHIPSGRAADDPASWQANAELRGTAAPLIAEAALDAGIQRLVQESITFPYADGADRWIDEEAARVYPSSQMCVATAESAAARVTAAGGAGVVLRFALFMAADSAHTQNFVEAARQGRFTMSGPLDGFISLVDVDDAAAAVVAALDAPAGIYNVAEPDPVRRSAHRDALAAAVSRDGLSAPAEPTDRLDGQLVDSLARSHRISSRALQSVTSWRPLVKTVERWAAATA